MDRRKNGLVRGVVPLAILVCALGLTAGNASAATRTTTTVVPQPTDVTHQQCLDGGGVPTESPSQPEYCHGGRFNREPISD
ncbi:MAG: hypothetical protein JO115_02690 [Pseudonocardiales bacterium]|nr:hypothetical protein [Pseudonocardiales bacterium]